MGISSTLLQDRRTEVDDSFIFKKIPLSEIASAFEMYKTRGLVKGKILIDSEA